jgi:hypothetical protein
MKPKKWTTENKIFSTIRVIVLSSLMLKVGV